MSSFKVTREISAPPARLWSILTDTTQLNSADFGILRLDGDIKPGARLTLVSEVNPKRPFKLRVAKLVPETKMVWSGGMPFGLFTGTRTFELRPDGNTTEFRMEEIYTGALSKMILKSIPDLQPSFEKFADALKERAET